MFALLDRSVTPPPPCFELDHGHLDDPEPLPAYFDDEP
jgi:hypothetical protein